MAEKTRSKNRNYPGIKLSEALAVAIAIQDGASGMEVGRLTLADLMGRSPSSSDFRELVMASRAYGLTEGGQHAEQFSLTSIGGAATGPDEIERVNALRKALMMIEPFNAFYTAYNNKKVPSTAAFKEFLVKSAKVPQERTDDCIDHLLDNARYVGLLRNIKGSDYIELEGTARATRSDQDSDPEEETNSEEADVPLARPNRSDSTPSDNQVERQSFPAKKVFIAHGKNRTPLDQLKKMLDQFKVKYAVAVDEPNKGRPISAKVATLMRDECSSAIFIFTADERFLRETNGEIGEVWRPSENVVYELGAASVLYDRRIVIFKESGVTFPSDFSDLGYISFESDQLAAKMGDLFAELVALDVLEVRAKG